MNLIIIRSDNLGDLVLFSGSLKYYRKLYPEYVISLYTKSQLTNLFENCPYINKIESIDNIHKIKETDIIINPTRSTTHQLNSIVKNINAKQKIGISRDLSNQTEEQDIEADYIYNKRMEIIPEWKYKHELFTTSKFLEYLGIVSNDMWPEFWTDEGNKRIDFAMIHDKPLIAIAPGYISTPGKIYNKYKEIVNNIEHPATYILLGSKKDEQLCNDIAKDINGLSLAGQTSINDVIEIIKEVDLVIAPDSGIAHISIALNKPIVSIMGGGFFGRFLPWGNPKTAKIVNIPMDCYYCNWKCIHEYPKCVLDINAVKVAKEVNDLLSMCDHT